jgi:hypothetical protein
VLGSTLALAVVGGALLAALFVLLARLGPSGDGWSLRGNGALVVPFGLGPAVLAGGWTALALQARRDPRWAPSGAAAALVGAVAALTQVAYLALGGRSAAGLVGGLSLVAPAAWTLAAPVIALLLARAGPDRRDHWAWYLGAAAVLPAGMFAGFLLASRSLPAA